VVGLSPTSTSCGAISTSTLTDWPLRFNTSNSATINTAFVIPAAAGTFVVALRNSLSTTDLQTATFNFTAAQVGVPQQITLNFSVPGSGTYQLTNSVGGVSRVATFTCTYPYTSGGFSIVGSATTSGAATNTNTYNSFFNLGITQACESPRVAVTATVNTITAITTQPLSQAVCAGANVTFTAAANGTALTYQWRKGGVNIAGATSATYTITNSSPADNGNYDVVITGTCGSQTSTVAVLSVSPSNSWLGAISTEWNNPANWCGGLPGITSDVVIPSGTPFSPIISTVANVRNLTINSGATLTTTGGASFNIYGNYVNNGTLTATTGFLFFRGTSNQSVGTLTAANVVVNGAGITLAGNLTPGTLVLQNGNITLGANNILLTGSLNGTVASHIITNGTGAVISNNIGAGPVIIPVGPDAATYDPVIIANGQGLNYNVQVVTGLNATIADPTKAVNRTWFITTNGTPAANVSVTLQYADAHANANLWVEHR
jgi:hypothetical protein